MPISQILLTAGSYSGPRVSWSNIYYSNVNEGQQNTVYLDFRDWVDSTVYWWIVDEGNNQISNSQLSSATSGTFSPGFGDYTNYESFNFTFAEDATTDGELTYYIRIENANGQLLIPRQGPFTVNDTSLTPTSYTATHSAANGGSSGVHIDSNPTNDAWATTVPIGATIISSVTGSFTVNATAQRDANNNWVFNIGAGPIGGFTAGETHTFSW
jgi:hypothetical protein